MTPEEKIAAKRIARIMRAARKQLALNQESVSSRLGISQSALSKLEHGTLIPSAPQWFSFCRMTGISTESLLSGYIDRSRPAILQEGDREGTFKIPRRYAVHRGTKVRALLPFVYLLRTTLGDKKANEWFKERKVDPDFFIDLDNQLNFEFLLDMARYLLEEKIIKSADLSKLIRPVSRPECHGDLAVRYSSNQGAVGLLTSLILNSRHYECDFIYRIEDQRKQYFDFSFEPERHLERFNYRDEVMADFLCRYKKQYFEQFTVFGDGEGRKPVQLQEVECMFKGANRCVYRLPVSV